VTTSAQNSRGWRACRPFASVGPICWPFAAFALAALVACESLGANGAVAAFEKAYLLRSSLKLRAAYRDDPDIAVVIQALEEMIARDPSDEVRPNAVMDELVALVEAGDLTSIDPLLATLRATANDCDRHALDCLEADIALQRHEFDQAFAAIDDLLTRNLHQTHGARPLSRGLANLYRTLESLISAGVGPTDQMRTLSGRVRARAEELHEQVVAESDGP
jgi:hypothetical protein